MIQFLKLFNSAPNSENLNCVKLESRLKDETTWMKRLLARLSYSFKERSNESDPFLSSKLDVSDGFSLGSWQMR